MAAIIIFIGADAVLAIWLIHCGAIDKEHAALLVECMSCYSECQEFCFSSVRTYMYVSQLIISKNHLSEHIN